MIDFIRQAILTGVISIIMLVSLQYVRWHFRQRRKREINTMQGDLPQETKLDLKQRIAVLETTVRSQQQRVSVLERQVRHLLDQEAKAERAKENNDV